MVEFDKVTSLMVRQKAGLFDFKEFYAFMYRWLTSEEYTVDEKEYTEKIKPQVDITKPINYDIDTTVFAVLKQKNP